MGAIRDAASEPVEPDLTWRNPSSVTDEYTESFADDTPLTDEQRRAALTQHLEWCADPACRECFAYREGYAAARLLAARRAHPAGRGR